MPLFDDYTLVRNHFLNPDARIAQEWTSKSSITTGLYVIDDYKYIKSGAMIHTATQSTDVPTFAQLGHLAVNSVKLDCTTVDSSIGVTDYCFIAKYIEGYNAIKLFQRPMVLRFWHKHTKTGIYCVALTNGATDRSFVREYTQSVSDTWEETVMYLDPTPSTGTWETTTSAGLLVYWVLAAGTAFQGTPNQWNSTWDLASSNQVNACDSTANNFMLCEPCIYPGEEDLGYFAPDFSDQLRMCKRYFEKSYSTSVLPGTITTSNSVQAMAFNTSILREIDTRYTVEKRDVPTVLLYDTQSGSVGNVSRYSIGNVHVANVTATATEVAQQSFRLGGGGTFVADDWIKFHYTADARF
jgi:hypothetical protein